jgi:hypothetical protein
VNLTPELAVQDCEAYLAKHGLRLSPDARRLLLAAEKIGFDHNRDVYHYIYLPVLIQHIPQLRSVMFRKGADPDEAVEVLERRIVEIESKDDDKYSYGDPPYSQEGFRGGCRELFIDFGLAIAKRNDRTEILVMDFLEGFLESHDEQVPPIENGTWADEALHVPYNTLSHIHSQYEKSLWVKFDDIRGELGLLSPSAARKAPLDAAPHHLKSAVLSFLGDHPDYRKNCFLIMAFSETQFHKEVHKRVKAAISELGFYVLRADDKVYADDVLANIEAYLYGCKIGIAVHERALSDTQNPNVAFEVGHMLGQKKDVCLLKERTVRALPSDLQGRLYVEFDASDLTGSLKASITKWFRDKHLIDAIPNQPAHRKRDRRR